MAVSGHTCTRLLHVIDSEKRLFFVCNCSLFCCTLLYVNSSIAISLMGKRELVALLLSSWCLVMVERLFLAVPRGLSAVCDCGIS